jgi:hypothetical protein
MDVDAALEPRPMHAGGDVHGAATPATQVDASSLGVRSVNGRCLGGSGVGRVAGVSETKVWVDEQHRGLHRAMVHRGRGGTLNVGWGVVRLSQKGSSLPVASHWAFGTTEVWFRCLNGPPVSVKQKMNQRRKSSFGHRALWLVGVVAHTATAAVPLRWSLLWTFQHELNFGMEKRKGAKTRVLQPKVCLLCKRCLQGRGLGVAHKVIMLAKHAAAAAAAARGCVRRRV